DIPIPAPAMAVVVNEIMYMPLSGEPEWVELVNTTTIMVNLKHWEVRDQTTGILLPEEVLPPGAYVVVTGDSAGVSGWPPGIAVITVPGFPALNNTGDLVILIDPTAAVIDQVDYTLFPLTTTGRSLEKVSPTAPSQAASSWVTSPAPQGHTAGRQNSVLLAQDQSGLVLEPNPLPLNTPSSILVVKYVTPFAAINLLVEIYDLAGRRLSTLANEGPLPGSGVVTWDARSVDLVRYKTGQYILLFRARDTGTGKRWERLERLILVH
ncbi:MAG: lamin tail domain-containing protein, partial [Candidatus Neomarinimicrobiota bacterium]